MKRITYLDSGSLGPSPDIVTRTQIEWLKLRNRFGPASGMLKGIIEHGITPELVKSYPSLSGWSGIESLRNKLAIAMGCKNDEISWAKNTTDAIMTVLLSLQLTSNDEILTTDIEHDSTICNCEWACREWKSSLSYVSLSGLLDCRDFQQRVIHEFERAVNNHTKVIILSHIAYGSGVTLPIADITRICQSKNPSVLILVDGAHSLGLVPFHLNELGCDFFATSGTKWLLAPEGTGILYARRRVHKRQDGQPTFWPFVSYQFCEAYCSETLLEVIRHTPSNSNSEHRLPELGTANITSLIGLNAALDEYLRIGSSQIVERITKLSQLARSLLKKANGVNLLFSSNDFLAPGIVCFKIKNIGSFRDLCQVVSTLEKEHQVICRAIPRLLCIRLSIHYFNTEAEIRKMVGAINSIIN